MEVVLYLIVLNLTQNVIPSLILRIFLLIKIYKYTLYYHLILLFLIFSIKFRHEHEILWILISRIFTNNLATITHIEKRIWVWLMHTVHE